MSSELFRKIEELVPTMQGWCTPEKACDLAALVLTMRPAVCLEIGVFSGRSAIPIALALKHVGSGYLIALDPWSASASLVGTEEKENQEFWGKQEMHDLVHRAFLRSIEQNGVSSQIVVERLESNAFLPPAKIDFIHLDGNHNEQAITDVDRFCPNVPVGAFVFMDDVTWGRGTVRTAVDHLIALGFEKLYDRDTGALFQRRNYGPKN